jgi:hypothetical protein
MDQRTAKEKVFTILELVEAILLEAHFSLYELLSARLISKNFNFIILNTLPFRRTLFLDAVETSNKDGTILVNPFLEKILPRRAKQYFDLVLHRYGREDHYAQGRDVLIGQGKTCKRCYSNRMDLASLPDEQYYLHLPLLETYDDEDYFQPAQWSKDALWRKMYVTRPVLPVHVVDSSPIAHRWEIAPKTTLGEIVDGLVIGKVVFSAPVELV